MGYYLNLVDLERWEQFLRRESDTWGFAEGRRAEAEKKLQHGARLICLLMTRQLWCGLLEVVGGPLSPDDPRVTSDSALPVRFPVRAVFRPLPVEEAISVFHQDVWPCLSRTRGIKPGAPHWNTKARLWPDLIDLGMHDGSILVDRFAARAQHVPLPHDADVPDPSDRGSDPSRVMRQIIERRGQQAFRDGLLHAYGGRCAITGCEVVDVLEAAHITPFSNLGSDHVTNGLLLRADLHALFDCGLIGVDPSGPGGPTVVVAERLRTSEYGDLHGRRIRDPGPGEAPNEKALRQRMERMASLGSIAG